MYNNMNDSLLERIAGAVRRIHHHRREVRAALGGEVVTA
jgi:hypothetical protein